ncbi:hypothetical protein [Streptomyces sp. NPDC051561]|uniref:hypothetical protein n=1 Tax=Streptomyces sp. NPDC051561 TaxID=3365658 RepID=UPI0037B1F6FF
MDQGAAQAAQAQHTPAAPPAQDRASQLTALAELKAQGPLTDEEFAGENARVPNA